MPTHIDLIAPEVYRISTYKPGKPVNFGSFLVKSEQSALIGTGLPRFFEEVRATVAEVVDPATLKYFVILHYEADECGSINDFLRLAPEAHVLCSPVGKTYTAGPFLNKEPRAVADGEVIDLGTRRLHFLIAPWVHLLDSMLAFEETTGTVFTSDLFGQAGDGPPQTSEDLTCATVDFARYSGLFPSPRLLRRALDRIERLPVKCLAPHHGSALKGDVTRYYRAFRDNDVADIVDAPFYSVPPAI